MTEAEVYDKVVAFLVEVNDEAALITPGHDKLTRIVQAHQNGPRITGDYASLNLLSHRDLREVDCDVYREQQIGGVPRAIHGKVRGIEWLFRVEIYATRATDAARWFQVALRSEYSDVRLSPLVIRRVDDVTRAPELIQQRWEGRANLDFSVAGVVVESTLTEFIERGAVEFDASIIMTSATFERT